MKRRDFVAASVGASLWPAGAGAESQGGSAQGTAAGKTPQLG
jgi:hypothetical protein